MTDLHALLTERVLVTGDRNWSDRAAIVRELSRLDPSHTVVVHGACRGADKLADEVARELGIRTEPFPADWQQYGRAAGPVRNQQMLDTGIDRVLAFHPNISESRGTADMVSRARTAGIPVTIFDR